MSSNFLYTFVSFRAVESYIRLRVPVIYWILPLSNFCLSSKNLNASHTHLGMLCQSSGLMILSISVREMIDWPRPGFWLYFESKNGCLNIDEILTSLHSFCLWIVIYFGTVRLPISHWTWAFLWAVLVALSLAWRGPAIVRTFSFTIFEGALMVFHWLL